MQRTAIGSGLRRARERKDLASEVVATRLGIAAGELEALEQGEGPPELWGAPERLADAYGVSLRQLRAALAPPGGAEQLEPERAETLLTYGDAVESDPPAREATELSPAPRNDTRAATRSEPVRRGRAPARGRLPPPRPRPNPRPVSKPSLDDVVSWLKSGYDNLVSFAADRPTENPVLIAYRQQLFGFYSAAMDLTADEPVSTPRTREHLRGFLQALSTMAAGSPEWLAEADFLKQMNEARWRKQDADTGYGPNAGIVERLLDACWAMSEEDMARCKDAATMHRAGFTPEQRAELTTAIRQTIDDAVRWNVVREVEHAVDETASRHPRFNGRKPATQYFSWVRDEATNAAVALALRDVLLPEQFVWLVAPWREAMGLPD